jgi:hypothetical protein
MSARFAAWAATGRALRVSGVGAVAWIAPIFAPALPASKVCDAHPETIFGFVPVPLE